MCTPAVKLVQDALNGMMNGNPDAYMSVVDDNIKFSCLAGLLPDDAANGVGKEKFMKMAGAQGEYFDQLDFIAHSWTGHGEHVGFVVDWKIRWKATNEIHTLKAIVHKRVVNGKICEKWHLLDQFAAKRVLGKAVTNGDIYMTKNVQMIQQALHDMYKLGKPETYMSMVSDQIQFSILDPAMLGDKCVGKSKEDFGAFGGILGERFEQVRFVPHSWAGWGDHVGFMVEWELKNKKTGKMCTLHAVVHKVCREGKLCEKWHFVDKFNAEMIGY